MFLLRYQTFSDLVNEIDTGGSWATGNINANDSPKFAEFYAYWGNYLEPTPAFLTYLMAIPGGIAKALYQITATLEHVFNNTFKLFGLFGYLGDTNTIIGNFFYWFQVLGTVLFTLILVVSAITGVFTKPIKYKSVITNFLLVTFVTSVLPLTLTTISTAIAEDAMAIQTSSSDDSSTYSSLAIQPMKNNVVDLKVLLENDFDQSLFPLDDYGYIKPVQTGSTAVNNITDATDKRDTADFATKIDFSANFGASNTEQLNDLEDLYPGVKGLFLHKLNSSQDGVATITTHKIVDGLNAFESVYLRYKVNWIGMFLQYGILITLLFSMSLKLVKSIFDILVEALISPIVGYVSSSSKKYKELLRTIGGALAGIVFEVIIMRVTLEICRDLPTLSVSAVTKLSGGFFDGLNMWEQCLASMLVYLGVFLAAMQGVAMVERWLGVSTGHNETAQQLIGAMMAGNAFAQGAGALATGAVGAAQVGANVASKVPGAVATGSKLIGNSLAATGGGIKGAFNSAKDQGIANAAKGGVSNMIDLADAMGKEAVGKVKDTASGVMDHLDSKAQAGHNAVYDALKNDAVTPKAEYGDDGYSLNPSGHYGGEALFPEADSSSEPDSMGGISDPTLNQATPDSETFAGVSDPTASPGTPQTKPTTDQPKLDQKTPNHTPTTPNVTPPTSTSSGRKHLSQSMNQMNMAGQQLNQASQRLQGQDHVKGAEIDESDE